LVLNHRLMNCAKMYSGVRATDRPMALAAFWISVTLLSRASSNVMVISPAYRS